MNHDLGRVQLFLQLTSVKRDISWLVKHDSKSPDLRAEVSLLHHKPQNTSCLQRLENWVFKSNMWQWIVKKILKVAQRPLFIIFGFGRKIGKRIWSVCWYGVLHAGIGFIFLFLFFLFFLIFFFRHGRGLWPPSADTYEMQKEAKAHVKPTYILKF